MKPTRFQDPNLSTGNSEDTNTTGKTLYAQMEVGGLNYIKNQKKYLLISAIIPYTEYFFHYKP